MKLWLLTIILSSSGMHQQWVLDEVSCIEEMMLHELVTKDDLWSATCQGPDGEEIRSTEAKGDIGP